MRPLIVVSTVLLLMASLCASAKPYLMSTGGQTGTYYRIGNDIIAECSETVSRPIENVVQKLGSTGAINDLSNKAAHMGIMQFDALWFANKQNPSKVNKKKWSILANLHNEPVHLVIPKKWKPVNEQVFWKKAWSKVMGSKPIVLDINVLKNQVVSSWGGSIDTASAINDAMGLNMRIKAIDPGSAASVTTPMFVVAGAPSKVVQNILDTGNYVLADIDMSKLRGKADFYTPAQVGYKVNGKIVNTNTMAVKAVLVAKNSRKRAKMEELEALATCIAEATPMMAEEDDYSVAWESAYDGLETDVDWSYFRVNSSSEDDY